MYNQISNLNDPELDLVNGGQPAGYKRCDHGTPAGGGAGLYPEGTNCSVTIGDLIVAFHLGIYLGTGGKHY